MEKNVPILKLKNVSKFYYNKGFVSSGFTKINLEFNLGEFVAITGESGSGKSTLLNVLSGLDTYEEGEMYINGLETSHYTESDFEHYRKTYIGNIFQSFNLVGSYTVYQNIELVLLLNGYTNKDMHEKIINLIKEVDLFRFRNTKVSQLSGGQKQRVAIARALAKDTPIIIADEPTGNLDSNSAKGIMKLLASIAKEKLVIVVTHNYEQVEKYATRKIEMHDGKVREDIILKETSPLYYEVKGYKDISFQKQVKLALRNTFNILTKFTLMFIVFLFIVIAFLTEYSTFKKLEYEESKNGYNAYFNVSDDTRIIIKKKDNTYFVDDEFDKIASLKQVDYINKDDVLIDSEYNLQNDDYYFWGKFESLDKIDKVDVGRMPQNDNEIVIRGYIYDYYLTQEYDTLAKQNLYLYNNYGISITGNPINIVGIIYYENYEYSDTFYASESLLNEIRLKTNEKYSTISYKINETLLKNGEYNLNILPNVNVKKGEVYISNDLNYLCKYEWCKNNSLDIYVNNLYYKEEVNLTITDMYTKYNFKNLTGLSNYETNTQKIFISYDDYNELFNKYTYQSSIYAKSYEDVDSLASKLENMGYKTLKAKDIVVNDYEEVSKIVNIFKLIVTIILFIVLFFISYFVIRLIQKSKNIYYATVRILGGSKKVIKNLISYELYIIFNIAFLLVLILSLLVKNNILNINFIQNITNFLTFKDFIIIYLIMFVMSMLISFRYSRKLFKSSAMRTYREEV